MKKSLILLLTLLLCVCMVGGCGGQDEPAGDTAEPEATEPEPTSIPVVLEMDGLTVTAELPLEGWCYKDSDRDLYIYNVPTIEDAASNSPLIKISIHDSLESFDYYIDDFTGLESIDNRTIGGIDMTGRTYENFGMEWIEYLGQINDDFAVSIQVSKVDISSGEGNEVINSIQFS